MEKSVGNFKAKFKKVEKQNRDPWGKPVRIQAETVDLVNKLGDPKHKTFNGKLRGLLTDIDHSRKTKK